VKQSLVWRVESLFPLADRIEPRLASAQKQVDALTPSLLALAFRGKLVRQDPADEPAAALIERINRDSAAVAKSARPFDKLRAPSRGAHARGHEERTPQLRGSSTKRRNLPAGQR
jgi:hypothetical protein